MAKKIGRPEKEVDWKLLDGILKYGAKLVDCASELDLSEDTIQRKIKEKYDITFSEYRERKLSFLRLGLMTKMYQDAIAGNATLMIWLSKQYLGYTDKQEVKQQIEAKIQTIEEYLKDKEAK